VSSHVCARHKFVKTNLIAADSGELEGQASLSVEFLITAHHAHMEVWASDSHDIIEPPSVDESSR
jgi:hypothetical protein